MISLSETGGRPGEAGVHEAFVVPGTTIGRYLRALLARPAATRQSIPADRLLSILQAIGANEVPVEEGLDRLRAFVEAARARQAEPVAESKPGGQVDETIAAVRRQLVLDPDGARHLLTDRIEDAREGLLTLLRERVEIERLVFDHEAAAATREEIARLLPDDAVNWIELGDLRRLTGSLVAAAEAYARAKAAASEFEDERTLALVHKRLGDVKRAQGDLDDALTAYTEAMRISERLAARDPANTEWQRDLSISHNKLGDVKRAQGDLDGALTAYTEAMRICERLAARDPANTEWQRDVIVSCVKLAEAAPAQAAKHLRRALAIAQDLETSGRLAPQDSWMPGELMRRLSALDDDPP